jgi:AcrR family transcriptional regulator
MTDPIQQQLIAARKNQILEAAAVVFAEKGFHPTTIRDIAKQAGISDGTIYNYFDNKIALLLGIFERMRAAVMADTPPPTDDLDLRAFVRMFIQHPLVALKDDNFALFRIVVSEIMVNEELRTQYYRQVLEPTLVVAEKYFEAHAAQLGVSSADARLTIRAISGMILGLMLEHTMGDTTLAARWEDLPEFLTDLIVDGLMNGDRS